MPNQDRFQLLDKINTVKDKNIDLKHSISELIFYLSYLNVPHINQVWTNKSNSLPPKSRHKIVQGWLPNFGFICAMHSKKREEGSLPAVLISWGTQRKFSLLRAEELEHCENTFALKEALLQIVGLFFLRRLMFSYILINQSILSDSSRCKRYRNQVRFCFN